MNEIQELFTSFILIFPDELNFEFGLFSLLIGWVFLALFPIVIQKSQKIDNSRIDAFAVFVLVINGLGVNRELTKTKYEEKLVECDEVGSRWLAQFIVDLD